MLSQVSRCRWFRVTMTLLKAGRAPPSSGGCSTTMFQFVYFYWKLARISNQISDNYCRRTATSRVSSIWCYSTGKALLNRSKFWLWIHWIDFCLFCSQTLVKAKNISKPIQRYRLTPSRFCKSIRSWKGTFRYGSLRYRKVFCYFCVLRGLFRRLWTSFRVWWHQRGVNRRCTSRSWVE